MLIVREDDYDEEIHTTGSYILASTAVLALVTTNIVLQYSATL
jgi:hypothetical protein